MIAIWKEHRHEGCKRCQRTDDCNFTEWTSSVGALHPFIIAASFRLCPSYWSRLGRLAQPNVNAG